MFTQSDLRPSDLTRQSRGAYDRLAPEYYLAERHPTCANFGAIQDAILNSFAPLTSQDGAYLEVGCGMGRLSQLRAAEGTYLTDVSESMLRLARQRSPSPVCCARMDAFCPHFGEQTLQGMFAFLGDPYNHPTFFRQAHRILRDGGHLVFTAPSHIWATALRSSLRISPGETFFLDRRGAKIFAPSITRSVDEQSALLTAIGFRLLATRTFTLEATPEVVPSHHVVMAAGRLGVDPRNVPLLDVFIATRRD